MRRLQVGTRVRIAEGSGRGGVRTRQAFIAWIRSLPEGTLFHTGDSSFCPLGQWYEGTFSLYRAQTWEHRIVRQIDNFGIENPDGSGRVTREQVLELVGGEAV